MKCPSLKSRMIVLTFITIPFLSCGQAGATSDPAQQAADLDFCKEHAKVSSGFDPDNPQASVASSGPPAQRGAGVRGAARGAARGAVVGGTVEHFGDDDRNDATETAAALGAVTRGARGRRSAKKQADAQDAQAISSGSTSYSNFYNECMKSRGY